MYEKAKPIEQGCLALFTAPVSTSGQIVAVGHYIGDREKLWALETPLINEYSEKFYDCPEKYLLRIDGPDIQKEIESERELEYG